MKYWGYFAAKLLLIAGLLRLVWYGLTRLMPEPATFLYYKVKRFPQDLSWTSALLGVWLIAAALVALAVWDQRRRCRVCLRRLRMPVESGFWSYASIFSPPRTESICPYGHGTLKQPEVHLNEKTEWARHDDDIWKELEDLEGSKK